MDSPILVIDSGLGGLAVAAALHRALPNVNIIFFGDTARLPYGNKSAAVVSAFVGQIIEHFEAVKPQHILIACNTATALALPSLQRRFPQLSISGVIAPCVDAVADAVGGCFSPRIGVIATEATVQSGTYQRMLRNRSNQAQVFQLATPLLVPIIEQECGNDNLTLGRALAFYFADLLAYELDVLILGCTHYTLVREAIQAAAGDIILIDSAQTCVADVSRHLRLTGCFESTSKKTGTLSCHVSGDAAGFSRMAGRLMGLHAPRAEHLLLTDFASATPVQRRLAVS